MGKVKIKKQSTIIDMTAMSDVTVLLLTFFMLTSTFLQKEPVQVITPPSISKQEVPLEKLTQILVGPDGSVYMGLTGTRDSSVLASEKFRLEVLETAYNMYRDANPNAPALTAAEKAEFSKLNIFGVKMSKLTQWLDMSVERRDEELKNGGGIPIELASKDSPRNEFRIWLYAIKVIMQKYGLRDDLMGGQGIAIKAGQYSPYNHVQVVMNNLQVEKLNKFTLMTALKAEEE